MTPADARIAIEQLIEAQWATGPATPIAYSNVVFVPPSDGNWLRVDFIWGESAVLTKGASGLNRTLGVLQLAVYGPANEGDGAVDVHAQAARAIINRLRLASPSSDVMFGAVSGPVKRNEESWRSAIVSAPFSVLETVP
jgi:Bacteriophage related domain of unknown function